MSELRYNLVSREWVIISTERGKRPTDFKNTGDKRPVLPKRKNDCPFCPGNEGAGGDETFRLGDKDTWRTRVIYNKYPALSTKVKEEHSSDGPYMYMTGYGIHEVIVEHPDHNISIPVMKDEEVADIIRTYKSRYESIQKDPAIKAITIFKNHGEEAGCSQEHPHSQLVATPMVPHSIRLRIESATDYFDTTGECLYCAMLKRELSDRRRLVLETEEFVSFVPYASPAPFVMIIIPRRHSASFDGITGKELSDLALNLRMTLGKLYYGLNNPDFNYMIRSVPVYDKSNESFHWHIAVVPRLAKPAGFELGSGMFINTSIPEASAEFLRGVKI
ncbi:MAG: galactose-1-phosphate uridylyltransferase [Candidatus Omnitrophota bacterium]